MYSLSKVDAYLAEGLMLAGIAFDVVLQTSERGDLPLLKLWRTAMGFDKVLMTRDPNFRVRDMVMNVGVSDCLLSCGSTTGSDGHRHWIVTRQTLNSGGGIKSTTLAIVEACEVFTTHHSESYDSACSSSCASPANDGR